MRKQLLSFALAWLSVVAWAQTEVNGLYYSFNDENMTATVERCPEWNGYEGDIVVPATVTYNGHTYTVANIADEAFKESPYLTTFTCGENIRRMPVDCFESCGSLVSATVNGEVEKIQGGSHYLDVKYSLNGISGRMFSNCRSIKSVSFGPAIKAIDGSAFSSSTPLETVHFSDSLLVIGNSAFVAIKTLKQVNFPASLCFIGAHAFAGTGLEAVSIHPVEASALTGDDDYEATGRVMVPSRFEGANEYASCIIDYEAFSSCSSLSSIDLGENICLEYNIFANTAWANAQPDGVLYIGNMTVGYKGACVNPISIKEGTKRLTGCPFYSYYLNGIQMHDVTLPQSLEIVDVSSFYGIKITEITIPSNVKYIGEYNQEIKGETNAVVIPVNG